MTKSEIEKLIEYIDLNVPKRGLHERYYDGKEPVEKGVQVYCKVNDVFDFLRDYPVEPEKTYGSTESKTTVMLFLDGNVTPLNFAKAVIDSELLNVDEISEMVRTWKHIPIIIPMEEF